jgi:N-acylglucosamine-6-phosphate 2-epimerase
MRERILADVLEKVRGRLIVSCQALPDEPLHGAEIMARMALAAWQGGAAGIRANGPADIAAIRQSVPLPIIGLYKDGTEGVYITPTLDHARAVAQADIIALDATPRPRPGGCLLTDLIAAIHAELDRPVLADVSTVEEALAAEAAGADLVAPTLAGYTPYSRKTESPDLDLVRAMCRQVQIPVIAEGHIDTPQQAQLALQAGAYAVVVGSAITRPQLITARFANALREMDKP